MAGKTNAEEWLAEIDAAALELLRDLDNTAFAAARAGVNEAQQDHPYTDRTQNLTNTAHPERVAIGISEMRWPMDYASFVDGRGYDPNANSSGPYKYVPIAEKAAEAALKDGVNKAVAKFNHRLTIVRGNRFV